MECLHSTFYIKRIQLIFKMLQVIILSNNLYTPQDFYETVWLTSNKKYIMLLIDINDS